MVRTGVWLNARHVWRDTWQFVNRHRVLIILTWTAFIACRWAHWRNPDFSISYAEPLRRHLPDLLEGFGEPRAIGMAVAGATAMAILQSGLIAKSVREVLAKENAAAWGFLGRPLWRCLGCGFAIAFLCAGLVAGLYAAVRMPMQLLEGAHETLAYVARPIVFLLACGLAGLIAVRLTPVFGQAATGRTIRWLDIWRGSRGQFWYMLGSYVCALLPVLLCAPLVMQLLLAPLLLYYAGYTGYSFGAPGFGYGPAIFIGAVLLGAALKTLCQMAALLLFGCCAAHLYKQVLETPPPAAASA